MALCTFTEGSRIIIDSKIYCIRRKISSDRLQLESELDGEFKVYSEAELRTLYTEGALRFHTTEYDIIENIEEIASNKIKKNFADYPEKLRNEAKRKLKYIRAFITPINEDELEQIITSIAEQIKDKKPPCSNTVREWKKKFDNSSEDINSLVSDYHSRGNRKPRFSEEVIDIVVDVIDKIYLTKERNSQYETLSAIRDRIELENKNRLLHKKLPKPGRRLLRRLIDAIDDYEIMLHRYGKAYADRHFREVLRTGERITEPLARVEIDHTPLDLIVVDPTTFLPIGRPTLTVALDRCTRSLLGYFVSFESAGYFQVMKCLAHAIKPKDYVLTKYPEIKNPWLCFGTMDIAVVDNGPEFYSVDMEEAALSLNMRWPGLVRQPEG